ncbi:hypothetical protein PLESTB_001401500 [Pleodorina starrii]|uniref:Uncharacterized protein n=1 Tax=Pleodorina starrii TaxID=330485 RepID=A0A9W6BWF5_9CHLO|nr:hypothetical protein PLESTB_001401500 [Pleodorina starrii]
MSALSGSPSRRQHSGNADDPGSAQDQAQGHSHRHSHSHTRSGSFSFGVLAEGEGGAQRPSPEPLLPEPFNRPHVHDPYAAYGIRTASASGSTGHSSGVEVAADPEGRFMWTMSGSSRQQQQLYRAGGNPTAAARMSAGGSSSGSGGPPRAGGVAPSLM